jgi:hypothetical protein
MKFIRTRDGESIINTAHIVSIGPNAVAELSNGELHYVGAVDLDDLVDDATVILASPGYRVVWPQDDDDTVFYEDVLAWRITHGGYTIHPITISEVVDNHCNAGVLSPDGSVKSTKPFEGSWPTLEEYLAARAKNREGTA